MISFDGHDFDELFIVGNPRMSVLSYAPNYADSQSRDGAAVKGIRKGTASVTFTLVALGSHSEIRDKWSTLGAWLDVDEPRKLVLPDTPDRYYLAVPDGSLDINRAINGESTEITFTVTEPTSYGTVHSVVVPSGGSVTFRVGGTAPARPVITASNATRNQSSLVWGLRLDDGDYVHVATGLASAVQVVADCDARTLSVNGAATIPTIDSDWLVLTPGTHTLRMDNGTGAATVRWRERWY